VSLRDQLDRVMPGWERWYPSVFDAAHDLGLIRARVCPPSQLLLSSRHAGINSEALQSFRERWAIEYDPEVDGEDSGPRRSRARPGPAPAGRKLRRWRR
jgi:hypothetical protein